jgi:hypothetical protein
LVSIEEKIETSSAAGELVFHVFSAIAHFERRLIAERTRDDLAAAAANGWRPGRKPLDPGEAGSSVRPDRRRSVTNQSGRDRALDPLRSPRPALLTATIRNMDLSLLIGEDARLHLQMTQNLGCWRT